MNNDRGNLETNDIIKQFRSSFNRFKKATLVVVYSL